METFVFCNLKHCLYHVPSVEVVLHGGQLLVMGLIVCIIMYMLKHFLVIFGTDLQHLSKLVTFACARAVTFPCILLS